MWFGGFITVSFYTPIVMGPVSRNGPSGVFKVMETHTRAPSPAMRPHGHMAGRQGLMGRPCRAPSGPAPTGPGLATQLHSFPCFSSDHGAHPPGDRHTCRHPRDQPHVGGWGPERRSWVRGPRLSSGRRGEAHQGAPTACSTSLREPQVLTPSAFPRVPSGPTRHKSPCGQGL